MRALSIRDSTELAEVQPYAELILRGIKTVEYRRRATRWVEGIATAGRMVI